MEKHQIILDNYLHGYIKFLIFYVLLFSILGSINYLINPNSITNLFIGMAFLLATCIFLVVFFGKKGLSISDKKLHRGISIVNLFFIIETIDLHNFSEFTFEKKEKTNFPWLLEYSGFGLFSNHNECTVYLTNSETRNNGKVLISISNFELYHEISSFLARWTELIEQNNTKEL